MQGSPHLSTREWEVIPPSDASVRRLAVLHTCPPAPGRAGDRHHGKGRALPAFPSSHEGVLHFPVDRVCSERSLF